jgi:hypothetical protein
MHGLASVITRAGIKQTEISHYQCGSCKVTEDCIEECIRVHPEPDKPGKSSSYCRMHVQEDTQDLIHSKKEKE